MKPRRTLLALKLALLVTAGLCCAQFLPRSDPRRDSAGPGSFIRIEGGLVINEDEVQTARETAPHSMDTPNWTNPPGFTRDVFTFARVIFRSDPGRGSGFGRGRRLGWWVDYPDADLNFSYRLQQMTSIRTDPDARVLKLTDPSLNRYPLIYMEHAGYMNLGEDEVLILRRYLNSGGALFVNDFWSTEEWDGFAAQIRRVFPDRAWVELQTDHPIFHCVYRLEGPMHRLRVPTIQFWNEAGNPDDPQSPLQRVSRGEGSEEMHVRALHDDKQRMMIVAIHNSDVSDGWEREAENEQYFNQFSEKVAYPLGINIIFYFMTH